VNIVETRHKVFPILGEATASLPSNYWFLATTSFLSEELFYNIVMRDIWRKMRLRKDMELREQKRPLCKMNK